MDIQNGDWVRSYGAGIWQVYRTLDNYVDLNLVSGKSVTGSRVFCKRFLNNSFKRSFATECCYPGYVYRLDKLDLDRLRKYIDENPETYSKFESYEPKSMDAVFNASIQVPEGTKPDELERILGDDREYTIFQVVELLHKKGLYASQVPDLGQDVKPKWTAQYISIDHAMKSNMLSYRFACVLPY